MSVSIFAEGRKRQKTKDGDKQKWVRVFCLIKLLFALLKVCDGPCWVSELEGAASASGCDLSDQIWLH